VRATNASGHVLAAVLSKQSAPSASGTLRRKLLLAEALADS